MLSLAELGFQSAVVYNLYRPLHDGNQDEINAIMNILKTIYRGVGIFFVAATFLVTPFLNAIVTGIEVTPIIYVYFWLQALQLPYAAVYAGKWLCVLLDVQSEGLDHCYYRTDPGNRHSNACIVQKISAILTDSMVRHFLKCIGKYTLELYVMQRLILEIVLAKGFQRLLSLLGRNYIAENMLIYYAVTLVFSVTLVSLLAYIAERIERIKPLGLVLFGKG